ncbi:ADP-ribosylglycohydrolase family protein [Aurantimonas sp. VKM B-3413]|uniref:ADP-ribosylglycohydrolase family protein n=1 Tax=Aurantimonas sp. VKM B-3413 TaxID=2779401 RepID=UPI001E5E364E|nr:ADP-ribosylglycohydrolase family protein [Aurantimonas sp. VKM B-3413]MCB8836914.1 ADP-ribosylglycohydrolase family protein [Aurantimonas sp. VKM B-3413]
MQFDRTIFREGVSRSGPERYEAVLLGAAFGDALGWPHEQRANAKSQQPVIDDVTFQGWTKRSGGRFRPHEERIGAGQYSDDTQLTIAVARSRIYAPDWWRHLAYVELPFWTVYQRGGGGASLRAAKLWVKGTAPWEASDSDRRRYLEAGGNGVAMRVAPHVLSAFVEENFADVARDIVGDGVTTHGHPRALVGALAFGYALWKALRVEGTLEYGAIIQEVLHGQRVWGAVPRIAHLWPTWQDCVSSNPLFQQAWDEAVNEVLQQLHVAEVALSNGALDFDDEAMQRIGCFDKRLSGAGTVAASAAIFLASKYAASPIEGVCRAAYARGADTDTIASMTGALAGAVSGLDWLRPSLDQLQDASLLSQLALMLHAGEVTDRPDVERVGSRELKRLLAKLSAGDCDVVLPINTHARVIGDGGVTGRSDKLVANSWRILDERNQTFFIKTFEKRNDASPLEGVSSEGGLRNKQEDEFDEGVSGSHSARLAGVTLSTGNIEAIRRFYKNVLGVNLARDTGRLIQLGSNLALKQQDGVNVPANSSVIYVDVDDIVICRDRVVRNELRPVSDIARRAGRLSFICSDPDGRTVEVFQR